MNYFHYDLVLLKQHLINNSSFFYKMVFHLNSVFRYPSIKNIKTKIILECSILQPEHYNEIPVLLTAALRSGFGSGSSVIILTRTHSRLELDLYKASITA